MVHQRQRGAAEPRPALAVTATPATQERYDHPGSPQPQIAYLYQRAAEFAKWYADYAVPASVQACPVSRRLIIKAGQLLAIVCDDLLLAQYACETDTIRGLDAKIEGGDARARM